MTLQSWISLALLWILFFWLYRDYRLDLFRQRLFSLRDELFDIAQDGQINFDQPAYELLRNAINGTIQYGHQLGFLDIVATFLAVRRDPLQLELSNSFERRWQSACSALSKPTVDELNLLRSRLHYQVAEQIIFTSFMLCITLIGLGVCFALLVAKKRFVAWLTNVATASPIRHIVALFDSSAAMAGS